MQETVNETRRGILTRKVPEDEGAIKVPILTPHLQFRDIGEQQTLLVSETFNTLLHGQLTADLLPLLDGQISLNAIVDQLKDKYPETAIQNGVASLATKGYVVSAEYSMEHSQAAYWTSLGASPRIVEETLNTARVSVHGDDGKLTEQLNASGVEITERNPQLSAYLCADYLEERLESVNKRHLDQGTPWVLVRPRGVQPLFGPVFHSDGVGPCWACLGYRLRNHHEVHSFLRNFAGDAAAFRAFATEPAVLDAIYRLIAAEVVKWLVLDNDSPIHAHAIAMNTRTFESSKHLVTRRPQCQACGNEDAYRPDRTAIPLNLSSSPKPHRNSGGARSVPPQVTLAKYKHLISPISGVITWLARTTDETDPWLHVYWAGSNLGIRSRTLSSLRRSLRSKSAGKGSTREQSEVSALCEAVERYSGAYHGDEVRTRKRFRELAAGEEAIHPNDVQLFSDDQLDNAHSINAMGHLFNVVPPRLDTNIEIDWTPVWSLTQRRHRYLPTSMLYSMPAEQRGASDLVADSNGCAAGNTIEEAILQGFYELVERDAFAIWWYNQLHVPAIDLTSFDDDFINSADDYYARCDRDVWLLDVTSDLGIPAFVALSNRPNAKTEDIIYGAGAHADPRIAALRAICELNQCLTWLPRPGSRDGRPTIDDPLALWWWRTARIDECRWLAPAEAAAPRLASDFQVIESDDSREDVEYCQTLVQSKGMELLVLDQTRPDIEMPVVRVIVPGMRHFWARFAPGRLYDVPVRTGYQERPLTESELNPAPVIA